LPAGWAQPTKTALLPGLGAAGKKPRFLPARDEVISAEIAFCNFSQ
jgi:hypothetical protein